MLPAPINLSDKLNQFDDQWSPKIVAEMDGFQFLAEFRKSEENRAVPVVVVTGADLDEAARRRLSGGVEHVLQKAAYSRNEMLAELKVLIARYIPEGSRS